MFARTVLPGLVALTVATGPAVAQPAAGERYFIVLFGTQSVPYRTEYTHTWATFVRTTPTAAGTVAVRADTISWMPATLDIRPFALRREPGVNLTLDQTYRWVASFGGKVSLWGPYEIDADRYARFLARKADLDSGRVDYRAIGSLFRDPTVSNCGQSFAKSSPIINRKYLQPTPKPGEDGTSLLALRYVRVGAFIGPEVTHDWLLPLIGADRYPYTRRLPGERIPRFGR